MRDHIFAVILLVSAGLAAAPAAATTVIVSSTGDDVDGDISSVQALAANPGPDGTISLREAVWAASNTPGTDPITITFAPALAGQTIVPHQAANCCFGITRDNVTIAGLVDQAGQPTVTIDASDIPRMFDVLASGFTLRSLRIVWILVPTNSLRFGVWIRPSAAKPAISQFAIRDNIFSNQSPSAPIVGVQFGPYHGDFSVGTLTSDATVAHNTFAHFRTGDAVKLQADGNNNTIQDVLIFGNSFTDTQFTIELVPNLSGNRILRTRIVGNSFTGNFQVININPIGFDGQPLTTGNLVDDLVISRNAFLGNQAWTIMILGGLSEVVPGVPSNNLNTTNNTISNVQIVNNLIGSNGADGVIGLFGGLQGSTGNRISGVSIVNNTLANNYTCGAGFCAGAITAANNNGSSGNTVSGVSVLNTIFWSNFKDFDGDAISPSGVSTSITATPGYAGINGNINANPLFVNATQGDYHLQSGSPARGAGTTSGAPPIDLDCQPRGSPPSIGAYEFNGPNICPTSLVGPLTGTHDFNGDGVSDVLWYNTSSGQALTWLVNGTSVIGGGSPGSAGNPWAIVGQRDFNGNGFADILWRNGSNGQLVLWLLNGTSVIGGGALGSAASPWAVVGTGDFNGDRFGDVLWYNTQSGQAVIWLTNGTSVIGGGSLGTVPSPWTIKGTGDFNGDGMTDILWYNTNTGQALIWFMNGTTVTGGGSPGTAASPWTVAGTGDFNGDGTSDILWLNMASGQALIWFLSGAAVTGGGSPGAAGTPWTIAETGDFNGDGMSDILWSNTANGQVVIWLLNGTSIIGGGSPGSAPSPWQVQGMNAD